jgi:hypothetical protein
MTKIPAAIQALMSAVIGRGNDTHHWTGRTIAVSEGGQSVPHRCAERQEYLTRTSSISFISFSYLTAGMNASGFASNTG